jgi:3D (Asp-Asp-Asp) domain-containing protein
MIEAHRAAASALLLLAVALVSSACATLTPSGRELVVTATAYNAVPEQTDRTPDVGAWGDKLRPGMRAIAVSQDLLALGLVRGSRVRIEGLGGEYRVLDTMPRRWQQRIDIFMGKDRGAARSWGKRTVRIEWAPPSGGPRWGFLCGLFGTCG